MSSWKYRRTSGIIVGEGIKLKIKRLGVVVSLIMLAASTLGIIAPARAASTVTLQPSNGTQYDSLLHSPFTLATRFSVTANPYNDPFLISIADLDAQLEKVTIYNGDQEIAWVRAIDATDPKLRVITEGPMTGANYLVRTIKLNMGKNILEVYIDGERTTRVAYSRK